MLWSGSVATIPGGWALCDGANGTPNLKNRFVVGAGDTYAVGNTGGAINHVHTGETDNHWHFITDGYGDIYRGSSSSLDDYTEGEQVPFTTDAEDGRPPYYALAYIMKL